MEARPVPTPGALDLGLRFERDGQAYIGELALAEARDLQRDLDIEFSIAQVRQYLPLVVVACALGLTILAALTLVGAPLVAASGRTSRDRLVSGFTFLRGALPLLLGLTVVLWALALVCVAVFEGIAILRIEALSGVGSGRLAGVAILVAGLCLYLAVKAVVELRRTRALFAPDPLRVLGRPLTREAAPGLWALLDDLSARLGALRPDNVVAGLTGGFFVSSGDKILYPGEAPLSGNTLYVPLPYLALMRSDEVAAIIGHELAHFSGDDTRYSQRFLPIYAGVDRSLDAVARAGAENDGSVSVLMHPALDLGVFVMNRFDHAVQDWSRRREFEADAAGAGVTSMQAAARAMLRHSAVTPRIQSYLDLASSDPDGAPADLVAAIAASGDAVPFDDPSPLLLERQPHPTDTHPPTGQRLAALGGSVTAESLAEATAAVPPDGRGRLWAYFADPQALCRQASDDLLGEVRGEAAADRASWEAAAAGIDTAAVSLHENTRPGAIFLFVIGALFLCGLGLLPIDVPGTAPREKLVIVGFASFVGLVFVVFGLVLLRRGHKPFMVLRDGAIEHPRLDRPLPWSQVADATVGLSGGLAITRFLIEPDVPMPAKRGWAPRLAIDERNRVVTVKAIVPKGLSLQGYAELIERYVQAEMARRALAAQAEREAGRAAPPPQMPPVPSVPGQAV